MLPVRGSSLPEVPANGPSLRVRWGAGGPARRLAIAVSSSVRNVMVEAGGVVAPGPGTDGVISAGLVAGRGAARREELVGVFLQCASKGT